MWAHVVTLNHGQWLVGSAQCLKVLNIYAKLFKNPPKGCYWADTSKWWIDGWTDRYPGQKQYVPVHLTPSRYKLHAKQGSWTKQMLEVITTRKETKQTPQTIRSWCTKKLCLDKKCTWNASHESYINTHKIQENIVCKIHCQVPKTQQNQTW